jgi:hypothetical protein
MANNPLVIVHGWSDESESFTKLARRIGKETGRKPQHIWLGDYVSLDDDVKISDLTAALETAWDAMGLSTAPNTQDVILHSTGGLILREWMSAFYTQQGKRPPVKNLVMLAPANFGSPLAHKGRSLIGRVFKGSNPNKPFETGEAILRGLEMASPFSWDLANRDRFVSNAFSNGGVRCTVIIGNTGYSGISGLVNEDGSDGTVYVSTANLNCSKLEIEVARNKDGTITMRKQVQSIGNTAFLILDGYDHGEITGNKKIRHDLLAPILKGLSVRASEFKSWREECQLNNHNIHKKYYRTRDNAQHSFQNTVFHVVDDQGCDIKDYAIEFYGEFEDEKDHWAQVFNKEISRKTHAYGDNRAYRSFMIDVTRLERELENYKVPLKISLTALPNVEEKNALVGYRSVGVNDIGNLSLNLTDLKEFFQVNRTLFITITLPRYRKMDLFQLSPLTIA